MSTSDAWLMEGESIDGIENMQPGRSDTASTQPQEGAPPQGTKRSASKGLLSSWRLHQLQQTQDEGYSVPTSVAEQETLKQPAIQQLQADFAQGFSTGQVSPHQSGINQLPILPIHAQMSPNMQAIPPMMQPVQARQPFNPTSIPEFTPAQIVQTAQPFNAQPFSAAIGTPNTQSQPLFGAMPGQALQPSPMQWQRMGAGGGNQQGGPPPFVQVPGNRQGSNGKGQKKKKRRFPIWARAVVAVLLVLLILTGSGAYYYEANFATAINGSTGQTVVRLSGDDPSSQGRTPTGGILSGKRINILLLGSDTDQKFQGGYLAQTDIVVTIDPTTKNIGMLSIPRDTWLQGANGKGMMKLDQAYFYGGVPLSRATIHQDFGIYIDYYAWVGLDGFIKVIDTSGGVDVDVIHPITDDVYPDDTGTSQNAYAYKRLYLAAGPQHLDGPTALEYVRSRHADLVGDFGRSARQQQVLNQLKPKLDNPAILGKLPELAKDLNGYVKTDMQFTDVLALMNFARTIDTNKINRVILDTKYSRTTDLQTQNEGVQSVVILNCTAVQKVIATMFALGNNAICNTGISFDGKSTSVASVAQTTPTTSSYTQSSGNSFLQESSQMASLGTMSLSDGSNDLLGMRSLLDLMFTVVFESPAGMTV
ncbi:MAG: LCP family protein [Ktedonobacteraceae bacterium]